MLYANDVLAAHHGVSGMNFIPGGCMILAKVQDAWAKDESQYIASGAVENKT